MKSENKCPKCGGEFEEGIIADSGEKYGKRVSEWGTKLSFFTMVLDNSKDTRTYRCKSCGYLESYAP